MLQVGEVLGAERLTREVEHAKPFEILDGHAPKLLREPIAQPCECLLEALVCGRVPGTSRTSCSSDRGWPRPLELGLQSPDPLLERTELGSLVGAVFAK